MSSPFPNEIFLHIFTNIDDRPTLRSICRSCRRFRALGMEHRLHTLVWDSKAEASWDLGLLTNNDDLLRYPVSVFVHPEKDSSSVEYAPWAVRIWEPMATFQNMRHLSVSNVELSAGFYHVLTHARALTHLSMDDCSVESPPDPLTLPSDPPISVTHLRLGPKVIHQHPIPLPHFAPFNSRAFKFIEELPLIQHLETEFWVALSQPCLPRLTSFKSTTEVWEGQDRTHNYVIHLLSHNQILVDLAVGPFKPIYPPPALSSHPHMQGIPVSLPPLPVAPALQTFVGPTFLVVPLLNVAPSLVSLEVTTSIVDTQQALDILAHPGVIGLHKISMHLLCWDEEVVRGVTQCLPECREVRVLFALEQPSEDFLFNLGIDALPRMPFLHTLHLHSFPAPREPYERYRSVSIQNGDGPPKKPAAVDPEEEDCGEWLAAWTRYNAELGCVVFEEGRIWMRRGVGAGVADSEKAKKKGKGKGKSNWRWEVER
ncbi:hypothetical protein FB45DRAFT_935623 [Roridomyces roridus]|uniref:F-box domain-containing protein n=1 Tax=Roridomyces roridus TaxID=1738132 RepID=A0AAD7BAR6_9AGAR|nr:hypothetical protein FB45DRAFT_935623 [Roridomyces roridus]